MEVVDLLNNDTLSQFYKGYHFKEEIKEERIKKVSNCNHLFALTDDTYSDPTLECVHCSLSNRTLNFYLEFIKSFERSGYKLPQEYLEELPFEAKLFISNYPNSLIDKKINLDLNDFNLISTKVLKTCHASILYHASREISKTEDSETIFQIMQELNSLETDYERIKIFKVEDAYSLIRRYFMNMQTENVKTYKKS